MLTIWKYPIPIQDKFVLEVPKGARVLAVQIQLSKPVIWMLVDSTAARDEIGFALVGTGHAAPAGDYVGTFQLMGGNIIYHLFVEDNNHGQAS